MTSLLVLLLLGVVVYALVRPPTRCVDRVSYDWAGTRSQATTLALDRLYEFQQERAQRMARYVAAYPAPEVKA